MTGKAFRIAAQLAVSLLLMAGCSSAPKLPATQIAPADAASPEEVRAVLNETLAASNIDADDNAALRTLEQNSAAASDAVKAIDIAREVAINNLSNAETTGYKAARALLQNGGKVRTFRDLSQGALESTNRSLDVAISGPGFFRLKVKDTRCDGIAYTRVGNLFINEAGDLVVGLDDGCRLVPPINVPRDMTSVTITREGYVEGTGPNSVIPTRFGLLTLAHFPNPEALTVDGALFGQTEASGNAIDDVPGEGGAGTLVSGFLESSNVDITRESIRLHLLNEWRATLLRAIGMHS